MRILLYINQNQYKFYANFGWFTGEPFKLIELTLFEYSGDIYSKMLTVLHIQIFGYLMFDFGFEKV